MSKVKIAEVAKPPKTTVPIPLYNSEPDPGKITNGINPFSVSPEDFSHPVEQMVVGVFGLFRLVMGILLIFEIFLVLKNKKVT